MLSYIKSDFYLNPFYAKTLRILSLELNIKFLEFGSKSSNSEK